nr:MAG TPA: hypothetical protein [Caudoviricetes sp.]DAT80945.1 MAG TPA: hypothetical protein [Caudoviricetes sp.]
MTNLLKHILHKLECHFALILYSIKGDFLKRLKQKFFSKSQYL